MRLQAKDNRQSSLVDDALTFDQQTWYNEQTRALLCAFDSYRNALLKGGAREVARFILPQSLRTNMYGQGNLRSWIHFVNERTAPEAQWEARVVARMISCLIANEVPAVATAIGWNKLRMETWAYEECTIEPIQG